MLPSEYLRRRAEAIFMGWIIPPPLDKDWLPYIELVRPMGNEWLDQDAIFSDEQHVMRLLLAAAIAEEDHIDEYSRSIDLSTVEDIMEEYYRENPQAAQFRYFVKGF